MNINKKSLNISLVSHKRYNNTHDDKKIIVIRKNTKEDLPEPPKKVRKQIKNNEDINNKVYEQQCQQDERSPKLDQFIESKQGNQENENQ